MRYMNLEVAYKRFIDVGRYNYDLVVFCENFIYLISINKGRTTNTRGVQKHAIYTCNYLIINTNLGIKYSILMHVIIL